MIATLPGDGRPTDDDATSWPEVSDFALAGLLFLPGLAGLGLMLWTAYELLVG